MQFRQSIRTIRQRINLFDFRTFQRQILQIIHSRHKADILQPLRFYGQSNKLGHIIQFREVGNIVSVFNIKPYQPFSLGDSFDIVQKACIQFQISQSGIFRNDGKILHSEGAVRTQEKQL